MKKILIFTVTAGEGHNSIAKTIQTELLKHEEVEIKFVDVFKEFASQKKADFINKGYLLACKYMPNTYNMFFKSFQKRDPEKREKCPAQGTIKKETKFIEQAIDEYCPDAIICTHFYPAMAITNFRKTREIKAKVYTILFDYTVHPFWECAIGVDYMFTPTADFDELLIYKGYKKEQLIPLGLPVNEKFSKDVSKIDVLNELELKDMFTILIMFGGGGMGGTKTALKEVMKAEKPIQILIVNGKDEEGKLDIDKFLSKAKTVHNIKNYGFVNFVDKLMSVSDFIVGKCGGVSVNESLNKALPMILIKKLAQQEKDNKDFLLKNKCAIGISKKEPLKKIIKKITTDNQIQSELKENIKKISKPNAYKEIIDFIFNQMK
ncbi:MAG: glycosyltransferase [Clostridia bacterium]